MSTVMTSYTTRVRVTADRRITVDLPDEMPLGEAEVTVWVDTDEVDEHREASSTGKQLVAWLRNREPAPPGYVPRTREEIDRDLQEMRDEWDR